MSKTISELEHLRRENQSLTLKLENQSAAANNRVQQMGQSLQDNQGMTGMQLDKMEQVMGKLKKENEGEHHGGHTFNIIVVILIINRLWRFTYLT